LQASALAVCLCRIDLQYFRPARARFEGYFGVIE
jgi:hypothetical protein